MNVMENESKMAGIPQSGNPDEWIKQRLAELGLSDEDVGSIVEGAPGLHAQGGRWKICGGCKSNIDMMVWTRGQQDGTDWPKLLSRGEVECPNCGAYGETFGDNAMNEPHPKLKTYTAKDIRPYPWASRCIRIGKAIVEQNRLFPADPHLDANEPHWPRDLAACVIGAALIVTNQLRSFDKDRPAGPKKWTPKTGSRPGNVGNRRNEQSGNK